MAWSFADGFDLYAVIGDAFNGYWDSGSPSGTLIAGRFAGSRGFQSQSGAAYFTKSSGVNDAVHHFVVSFEQTGVLSGTNIIYYFELFDGTTAQCSVGFRSDGAILLQSGAPGGTTLATYTGAVTAINTWYGFEIEVSINNTTGSFAVRKNGNAVNDFSATSLNTRGGTANNYANKLTVGVVAGGTIQVLDDLFWQSGAGSGTWLGELRCVTMMPASDQSAVFSRGPASVQTTPQVLSATQTTASTSSYYQQVTAAYDGTIGSLTVSLNAGFTGNMKCSIFNDNAGVPGTVLGSAGTVTNPSTGNQIFTFSSPPSVAKGVQYWVGVAADGAYTNAMNTRSATGKTYTVGYSAFPTANPSPLTSNTGGPIFTWTLTVGFNYTLVNEPQQDGPTSYVYDSNPGDADFYGLSALVPAGASVLATTARAYMQKSDVGTRTAALQLKSSSASGHTTWSTTDKTAGVTLSSGNLTAATSGGSNNGVRGGAGWSTGKYYFEATMGWLVSSDYIGIATSAAALNNSASLNTCVLSQSGTVLLNNVSVNGSFGARSAGDVIGIAVDLVNSLIWFRVAPSGNWNASGTANPATGVGGVNFAAIGNPTVYPYAFFVSFAYSYIANFGATSFTGAVPSGFTSGWPGLTSTTVAAPTVTLTTSGWQWDWRTDLVDPNTSAAWTAAAVNAAQIGPTVVA